MKKTILFFALVAIAISCERIEMQIPTETQETEASSQLIMKVGSYTSNLSAEVLVEKNVATGLSVTSKEVGNSLTSASWKINNIPVILPEGSNGLNIIFTFTSEGEQKIEVVGIFQSQKSETRTFTVISVIDITSSGPAMVIGRKLSSSYDVWVGWNTKWTRGYLPPWSVVGDMTDWRNVLLSGDHQYNLDTSGNPILTNDIGKYIGAWFNIKNAGLYKVALSASNGNWVSLAGSPFVTSAVNGMVTFQLNSDGSITPKGEGYTSPVGEQLPGTNGDRYFRFTEIADNSGKVSLFFRLTDPWTNKSFCVRDSIGGLFTNHKMLSSVTGFPNWGVWKEDYSKVAETVSQWRYGPDFSANVNKYSSNMDQSVLYDNLFKSLRLQMVSFQPVKSQ